MIEGFTEHHIRLPDDITLRLAIAGDGPPVLLLHGYPQTHMCWHKVAPELVRQGFTVVAPDLRGYGGSSKPDGGPDHAGYAKRAMAADQVTLMRQLGFARFDLVGHDRGGRVAHRLALDHPATVRRWAVLDIAPTATMYERTDRAFATAYYHWFFLIQPAPLPERLIGADPEFWLRRKLSLWSRGNDQVFSEPAMSDYLRWFEDPATIHASCEDYRAAASIDLEHDALDVGRKVAAPLLALWGSKGTVGRLYDVLATWRDKAESVIGGPLPCGHFLPEECPEQTLAALLPFLQE